MRDDSADRDTFDERALAPGLAFAERFADARVFVVSSHAPAVYTRTMIGFFPREYSARPDVAMDGSHRGTRKNSKTLLAGA